MKHPTSTFEGLIHGNAPTSPAFTRALRAAIRSSKLEQVLLRAGATKLRGTPVEVLEEVAAAQTAAWVVGSAYGVLAGPVTATAVPHLLEAAAEAIDDEALIAAGEIVGVYGASELGTIRTHLITNMARIAIEANRFAQAETRPVCHSCVAIGGLNAARQLSEPVVVAGAAPVSAG